MFSYVSWWVSWFWFVFLPNSGKPTVESGEGNGNPLQDLCLKNPTARGVLAGYSPWGCKQSDMIEQLALQFSRSAVSDSAIPWTAACQASLSVTNSWSLPKLMCIESVMPSNHLLLCSPLLFLPSIFPSIRVFKWVSYSHEVAKVLEFQLQH